MVWELIPVDSNRSSQKYYIFSKGTYKVGRKGCDIVPVDAAVSRLHAEIVVDEMTSLDRSCSGSGELPSCVHIRDTGSKYGTFINKELGDKAVRIEKYQDVTLKDGDLVTFGTGNASFRFSFVPIIMFIHGSKPTRGKSSFQATASSIGASTTSIWNSECTHFLCDESSSVTLDLIKAVAGKKPVILSTWLKVLAEKNIRTEFPSCSLYVPNLTLEGTCVKVVEPKGREKCLEGFTFVLGSSDKYKFGDMFQSLLEVAEAKFLNVDDFCSSSQTSADVESTPILVMPGEFPNEFNQFRELSSLSSITDIKLVAAILCGHLDPTILVPPSIVVSSSHSTGETIVADSDVETDTATSDHVASTIKCENAFNHEVEDKERKMSEDREVIPDNQDRQNAVVYPNISPEKIKISSSNDENIGSMRKLDRTTESLTDRHENSDIIYSQALIVKNIMTTTNTQSNMEKVINFKCFRKRETASGNSFKDLIPFSRDPYKESDGASNESEYTREERKRKQLEAIAEDLFNNERAKKRAKGATSLETFLARR